MNNDKYYKVKAKYPSGLELNITVKPGDKPIIVERAIKRNGELLHTVTIEPMDDGGYVCVETGEPIYVKMIRTRLIVNMEAACQYVQLNCKNKLNAFSAEWPIEVEPIEEIWPEKIKKLIESPKLADEEKLELMQKIVTSSVVGALQDRPAK